ncbi:MAG: hypothetical protein GWO87_00905 [Xanthomonadaceae bacterium]|nr:hypothetical protein [Rhodospirillaceae bacterium]NIA17733.1 hypothetical protein [Xanthomonadaceae bacterium]
MKNIEDKLKNLGISRKEAKIYIAALKIKKVTVAQIAVATEIKRTTVYHCLDSLIEKGLISKITKDDKKYYFAENPKASLNNLLREQKDIIADVLPKLKNIFGQDGFQPEIRIYRHKRGIKKVFENILTCQEKIDRYYISDFNVEDLLGEKFVDEFVKKRIKAGIKSLSLRSFKYKPRREKGILHIKQLREARFMPGEVNIKPYICIYDNKVAVISSKEEHLGFIIESKDFSDAQKAIFDIIWNNTAI